MDDDRQGSDGPARLQDIDDAPARCGTEVRCGASIKRFSW